MERLVVDGIELADRPLGGEGPGKYNKYSDEICLY